MKISIVTPCFNSVGTIEGTIKSVLSQTYPCIEHIVVDGGSTDRTLEIVDKYRDKIAKIVSEKDRGVYDGMNKGIRLATGDIVGILNSDDFYTSDDVIKKVVGAMEKSGADCCWGDLVYVDKKNTHKVIRRWKSSEYKEGKFKKGWHPAHPTFFVRRWVYEKYGLFNLDFPISADYELMLRFLEKYKIKSCYIPEILVKMRIGGQSNKNIKNIIKNNIESYWAWKKNGLRVSPLIFFFKPLSKVAQYFKR